MVVLTFEAATLQKLHKLCRSCERSALFSELPHSPPLVSLLRHLRHLTSIWDLFISTCHLSDIITVIACRCEQTKLELSRMTSRGAPPSPSKLIARHVSKPTPRR